jgi:hypothetical protein
MQNITSSANVSRQIIFLPEIWFLKTKKMLLLAMFNRTVLSFHYLAIIFCYLIGFDPVELLSFLTY